jgi:prepilin-type N-terminal cleavage/methylation domain-containing protein
MRTSPGFTLIEMICSVVILGIIAVFGTMFLTTGMRGALSSRLAEENGQKAQIALERIGFELRDINGTTVVTTGAAPSIQYVTGQAKLSGTRTLAYDNATGIISLRPAAGGTAYALVDGVNSCAMSFTGTGHTTTLNVSFTLSNTPGSFSISVKPRQAALSL